MGKDACAWTRLHDASIQQSGVEPSGFSCNRKKPTAELHALGLRQIICSYMALQQHIQWRSIAALRFQN